MICRTGVGTGLRGFVVSAFIFTALGSLNCCGQAPTSQDAQNATKVSVLIAKPESQAGDIEHWDVLTLAGNNLHAAPPLLGEKVVQPGFTRELIEVQWRAHDPIDLYVIRPTKVVKPPIVIFLYSYPSETGRFLNDTYCQSIVDHGMAAVGFVSALTGQRYHERPMKEWFISELPESLGSSVHDVQMILNYLATRNDLDMERVGMYGQGSGGTIAILSAAVEPRIKAVDVLDPWGDWPDWIATSPQIPDQGRASYLSPKFLEKAALFDPIRWLPELKSRPFRLQQTMFSEQTPMSARDRIRSAIPANAQVVQYKELEEYKEKASAGAKILDWLQAQLHTADGRN
jgi:hypothetical protein